MPIANGAVIQGRFATSPARLAVRGGPGPLQPARPHSGGRGPVQPSAGSQVIHLPPHLTTFSSRGEPLPPAVREKMESFFRADLGDVRVHVGPEATRLGALAFTQGAHIYFAPGQYSPESVHGQQLLGHELTHVQQQRAGRVRSPYSTGVAIVQDPALEAEADRSGRMAASHRPVQRAVRPGALSSLPVARDHVRIYAGAQSRSVGSVDVRGAGPGTAEVTDLRVDASHRKQGLGVALLTSAMSAALRMGKKTVRLSSGDDGSGRLTAWYRRLGFRPVGVDGRGLTRLEAPVRTLLPKLLQAKLAPPEPRRGVTVTPRRVVQRAEVADVGAMTLSERATQVHDLLGSNARANSATTIAFADTTGGMICTSNDVSQISTAAENKAIELGAKAGVAPAGAGFHAEMWMLVNAFVAGSDPTSVSGQIKRVGASRDCCKHCTLVLRRCGIPMDQPSTTSYKSWYNPLTTSERSEPREDFAKWQRRDIPDFRLRSTDYWWTDTDGHWTKTPRGT